MPKLKDPLMRGFARHGADSDSGSAPPERSIRGSTPRVLRSRREIGLKPSPDSSLMSGYAVTAHASQGSIRADLLSAI
jgi:hypothetical protein